MPLIVTLKAQIDSEEPPHRLHATARAEHLTMEIDVTLQGAGATTELLAQFDVKGEGQLKPIVDRLFEKRATERAAQFADCLEKRFGAVSSRDAPAQLKGRPVPWIRRWLNRLWRRFAGQGES